MTTRIDSLLTYLLTRSPEKEPSEKKVSDPYAGHPQQVSDTFSQASGKNSAPRIPVPIAMGIFAAGCSSPPENFGSSILPAADKDDAGTDAGNDAVITNDGEGEGEGPLPTDAGHDAGHDAGVDATRDTGEGEGEGPVVTDAGVDAGEEAGRDAGADVAEEVGADATADAEDAAPDAAPDAAEGEGEGPVPVDTDGDRILDDADNCPLVSNPFQENQVTPNDDEGDACDHSDADGVVDAEDNCPLVANQDQADNITPNGRGDVCEDTDADGFMDAEDNCPRVFNRGQENFKNPATPAGDHCEDSDNDTILDFTDNCVFTSNPDQADREPDGVGDACSGDLDGDGVLNEEDNCEDVPNPNQEDSYGPLGLGANGIGDHCEDSDTDGALDVADRFPLDPTETVDTDGDGFGDNLADNCPAIANADQANLDGDNLGDLCDDDADGDGLTNEEELNHPDPFRRSDPLNEDTDGDTFIDSIDRFPQNATEWADADNDDVGDNLADNCPGIANDQADLDEDAIGDACDDDADGDGLTVAQENALGTNPLDPDSDDDTFGDAEDRFPMNAAEWADTDADGVGDNDDNCPVTPNANQADRDGDDAGDACDHLPQPGEVVAFGVDENGDQFLTVTCTDEDGDLILVSANIADGLDLVANGVSALVPGPEATVTIPTADLPEFAYLCWKEVRCEDATGNVTPFADEDMPCFDNTGVGVTLYYPFDGVEVQPEGTFTPDRSGIGQNRDLQLFGANGLPTVVAGVKGNAIRCDGVDDYLQTPQEIDLGIAENFEVSFWIYLNRVDRVQTIFTIGKREANPDLNSQSWLELIGIPDPDGLPDQKLALSYIGDNREDASATTAEPVLVAGEWQHITITSNGQSAQLYVDEILELERAVPPQANRLRFLGFCRELGRDRRYVDGALDEAVVRF